VHIYPPPPHTHTAIPFDFIVGGQFLRGSLSAACERLAHSRETVLLVEYLLARRDPTAASAADAGEWVSALSTAAGTVAAGAMDGTVKLYRAADLARAASVAAQKTPRSKKRAAAAISTASIGAAELAPPSVEPTAGIEAHDDAVTAVAWARDAELLLTASMDGTVRGWFRPADDTEHGFARVALWEGHGCAVQGLAVAPNAAIAATGAWDGTLRLWRVPRDEECVDLYAIHRASTASASGRKRGRGGAAAKAAKKDADGNEAGGNDDDAATALAIFTGHTQRCDAVSWTDLAHVHSASWDHTVRRWDAETGVNIASLSTGTAALCIAATAGSGAGSTPLVVSGHADFSIRVWDPRDGAVAPQVKLSSHRGWVTSIAAVQGHEIVSASYDGTIKVWDVRASVPLHTIEAHAGQRAMAVAWCPDQLAVVSGGTDSIVRASLLT
jgi:ribosome biogenesis protein YTM1